MKSFLLLFALLCLFSDGFLHPPSSSPQNSRSIHHVLHMKIDYRNAQISDIESIAALCAEIFDGPFPWHQPLARTKSIGEYKTQFNDRLLRLVDGGIKHAMIVAVDEDNSDEAKSSHVIGFLEVGMLPCPVEPNVVSEQQPISNTIASTSSESIWEDVAKAQSQASTRRNDVPYLGNVAVLETYRRQGVGQKLVRIGIKIAEKWKENDVWVAVENRNMAAIRMYDKLKFVTLLNEEEQINRSMKRSPRRFMRWQTTISTSSQQSDSIESSNNSSREG